MSGTGRSGLGPASGDMNHRVLNNAVNTSGPNVGASSLVTDASSALPGRPQLQTSTSINTESYIRLPASPVSFSSNNISGSSMMDGSSFLPQSPHHDQVQNLVVSSAMSQPTTQEVGDLLNARKKPRLDMTQGSNYQQQVIQQLMQRHEPLQLQGHQNPQLQAIIRQQRLAQCQAQHQSLQSFPQIQQAQTAHHQQHQLRHHLEQQTMQPVTPAKCPLDKGLCARRLMQYMYHQRNQPADNSIQYWKKFVTEYFAPRAKKRWCFSMYDNIKSNHALGVFPQAAMDAWQCSICGSRSGKGFEATFEILPRLCHFKFNSGVIDELLLLGMPHERQLSSGIMVLEYAKVAQESVYEHIRVVHEGQLRIIFTPELKILSWEFCARRHEEFLPRRLLAPQVSQLLHAAQKYQTAVAVNGSAGVLHQDFQTTCNMLVQTSCQVAKKLELPSLNDLGFSKRYVRCLQISEVVNSMKDLIDFSKEHKIGPLETLKNYPRQVAAKLQNPKMEEPEQLMSAPGLPADQSTLSKIIGIHPGRNSNMNNNIAASRVHNNIRQGDVVVDNYQNLLRNHVNTNQNKFPQEASRTINGPSDAKPGQIQGSVPSLLTNMSVNGLAGTHQQHVLSGTLHQQNNLQPSQVNQQLHQRVIQQLLQEVINNRGAPQQAVGVPNANGNMLTGEGSGSGIADPGGLPVRMNAGSVKNGMELGSIPANLSSGALGPLPSRSNSFNSVARNPAISGNSLNSGPDLPQRVDLPERDQITPEFAENGIFNGEPW